MNFNQQLQEAYEAGYYRALNEQLDIQWFDPTFGHPPLEMRDLPSAVSVPTDKTEEEESLLDILTAIHGPRKEEINQSYEDAEAVYGSDLWNKLTPRERDNLARHFRENPVSVE